MNWFGAIINVFMHGIFLTIQWNKFNMIWINDLRTREGFHIVLCLG